MASFNSAYRQSRMRVIKHLGGKCVRCGFSDARALQFDHVNGDGWIDRLLKVNKAGLVYHQAIIDDKEGRFQLLCANCNWIKREEEGEFHIPRTLRGHINALKHQGINYQKVQRIIEILDNAPRGKKTTYTIYRKDGKTIFVPETHPPDEVVCAAPQHPAIVTPSDNTIS